MSSLIFYFWIFMFHSFILFEQSKYMIIFHWKFLELSKFKNLLIFEIVKVGKFGLFPELEIVRIFQIGNLWNFPDWKINKYSEFFHLGKLSKLWVYIRVLNEIAKFVYHIPARLYDTFIPNQVWFDPNFSISRDNKNLKKSHLFCIIIMTKLLKNWRTK